MGIGGRMENMNLWNALKQPPKEALKEIRAGRLKGKSDINPQWRYQALTEQLGVCGKGWKYEITKLWNEPASDGQVFAFATVNLYLKHGDEWSHPIPGIGGSMLIANEKHGPYSSDEAYKMAVTDALSVAMKMIGVAADIYAGKWDGSKYVEPVEPQQTITEKQHAKIVELSEKSGADYDKFLKFFGISDLVNLPASKYQEAVNMLTDKIKRKELKRKIAELSMEIGHDEFVEILAKFNAKDILEIPYVKYDQVIKMLEARINEKESQNNQENIS